MPSFTLDPRAYRGKGQRRKEIKEGKKKMGKRNKRKSRVGGSVILEIREKGIAVHPRHRLNDAENMRFKLKPLHFNNLPRWQAGVW